MDNAVFNKMVERLRQAEKRQSEVLERTRKEIAELEKLYVGGKK